jgi:nicotinamidase/pyrazinamidase
LATDFCVAYSPVDARKAGFEVVVIEDACREIDTGGSLAGAWVRMNDADVARATSNEFLA